LPCSASAADFRVSCSGSNGSWLLVSNEQANQLISMGVAKRSGASKKVLAVFGIFFVLIAAALADRLIFLRRLSWEVAAAKGIGPVYRTCGSPLDFSGPLSGARIIELCRANVPVDFAQRAKVFTVFPGGCSNKAVVAWGPEIHHWGEPWYPLSPGASRAVLFADGHAQFISQDRFAAFGCP
jgi:prepilin-type processing-associated H-X9-DG protein